MDIAVGDLCNFNSWFANWTLYQNGITIPVHTIRSILLLEAGEFKCSYNVETFDGYTSKSFGQNTCHFLALVVTEDNVERLMYFSKNDLRK